MVERMMNFPAIATAYAGFNFRSRLEAKYAVLFDLCKWTWSYEPETEFTGWIPDFALGPRPVYVEVKPFYRISEWDDTIAKITASGCQRQVLLLGTDPVHLARDSIIRCGSHEHRMDGQPFFCGLLTTGENVDRVRRICFGVGHDNAPAISTIDHGEWAEFAPTMWSGRSAALFGRFESNLDLLQRMWSQACNVVQWLPDTKGRA